MAGAGPAAGAGETLGDFDPYGHFWWPRKDHVQNPKAPLRTEYGGEPFVSADLDLIDFLRLDKAEAPGAGDDLPVNALALARQLFQGGRWAALPERILNPAWKAPAAPRTLDNWVEGLFPDGVIGPDLPKDAIIIGVIDTGVPLHHRRSMYRNGQDGLSTRILAAWQQAAGEPPEGWSPDGPPFGAALNHQQIDSLLSDHELAAGGIDEAAFNRAAQLVQPGYALGHRALDFRAAHGAHVLDLVGGMDPDFAPEGFEANDFQRRVRFVVVNLPPPALHGTAGTFLQYYASFALQWVVSVSETLWRRKTGKKGAFPVAVNLSFGMHAGPKDGTLPFELLLRGLIRGARPVIIRREGVDGDGDGQKPGKPRPEPPLVRLSMPVGNDNLSRTAARLDFPKTGADGAAPPDTESVAWRVPPGDQTANFVEIWSDPVEAPGQAGSKDPFDTTSFDLLLTLPGGEEVEIRNPNPDSVHEIGAASGEEGFARVFAQRFDYKFVEKSGAQRVRRRVRFVIAARPTLPVPEMGDRPAAPAGLWRLALRCCRRPVGLDLRIQTDQPLQFQSRAALSSYFDDPAYRRFDERGAPLDSFVYPAPAQGDGYTEGEGPVTRLGTVNAMASTVYATTIGGHRASDGRPAPYSATGYREPGRRPGPGWRDPERRRAEVSLPTDDAPGHPGLLGAGSSDGSAVLFRGTSMASALSVRLLAEAWLKDPPLERGDDEDGNGDGDCETAAAAGDPAASLVEAAEMAPDTEAKAAAADAGPPPHMYGRAFYRGRAEDLDRKAGQGGGRPPEWDGAASAVKAGAGRLPAPETYRAGQVRRLDPPGWSRRRWPPAGPLAKP